LLLKVDTTPSKQYLAPTLVADSLTEKLKNIASQAWFKWVVLTTLVALLAFYFFRNQVLGTPTDGYPVVRSDLVQTVVASGRVISPERVTVAVQGTGRVQRIAVVEGQVVKRGQLLIELDNNESRAALAQASATVAQAKAKLRQLGELSEPVALQTLAQAQATLLQAQKLLARNRELVARGFISQAAVDDSQRIVDVAMSQVASAQAQVRTHAPLGSDAAIALAALAQAQAGEQLARVRLTQGEVLAPNDGVLISRSVEVGDIVQPGKVLMVLASSGQTQVLIHVDEKNLAKIAFGQEAIASADSFPNQRFKAFVGYINPGVDATRGSVEVKLNVPEPPAYLRQDMTVSIDIETARRKAVLVIPSNVLMNPTTDHPSVLVVRDKHARKQSVKLGLRGDDRVEVLEGIAAAEIVIPVTKVSVKANDRVRTNVISPATSATSATTQAP
jgi:HlyD family secretion protein